MGKLTTFRLDHVHITAMFASPEAPKADAKSLREPWCNARPNGFHHLPFRTASFLNKKNDVKYVDLQMVNSPHLFVCLQKGIILHIGLFPQEKK